MIIIYVRKSWLDEIGDTARQFLVEDWNNELACLCASKTETEYPFVVADLARTKPTPQGETFLTAHIPAEIIRGIFDLTEAEKKKLGF